MMTLTKTLLGLLLIIGSLYALWRLIWVEHCPKCGMKMERHPDYHKTVCLRCNYQEKI